MCARCVGCECVQCVCVCVSVSRVLQEQDGVAPDDAVHMYRKALGAAYHHSHGTDKRTSQPSPQQHNKPRSRSHRQVATTAIFIDSDDESSDSDADLDQSSRAVSRCVDDEIALFKQVSKAARKKRKEENGDGELDLLGWFSLHSKTLPLHYYLIRQAASVLASESNAERAFSIAGDVSSGKRSMATSSSIELCVRVPYNQRRCLKLSAKETADHYALKKTQAE